MHAHRPSRCLSSAFGVAASVSTASCRPRLAVDALPDARFVGFAQNFNDFEIASGRMALAKSAQREHARLRVPHGGRPDRSGPDI